MSEFQKVEKRIRRIIALVREFDPEFQVVILDHLLRIGLTGSIEASQDTPPSGPKGSLNGERGLAKAASEVGVDVEDLGRILSLREDGGFQVLARIDGDSVAERAKRYAAVYCFISEKAFGELDSSSDEIRELLKRHGCYDQPNFTKNMRAGDYFLEIGKKGSPNKRYRLSAKGEELAKNTLSELLS